MTDEQINRKFELVADHLVTLAVNMQKLEEAQTRSDQQIVKLKEQMARLAEQQAEGFERLTEAQTQMAKEVRVFAKAQARADARLDSFMEAVERFISETRNGKGKK
jgi:hypothetical protein